MKTQEFPQSTPAPAEMGASSELHLSPREQMEKVFGLIIEAQGDPSKRPEAIESAYGLVVDTMLHEVRRADPSDGYGGPFWVFDMTSRSIGQVEFSDEAKAHAGETHIRDPIGGMVRGTKLAIDFEKSQPSSGQTSFIISRLNELNVGEFSPQEVSGIMLLRTVAHEAGHVFKVGVGRMMGMHGDEGYDFAAEAFLGSHPLKILSPDLGRAKDIWQEQFAEGFANMFLAAALRGSSYSNIQQMALVYAMGHTVETAKDNPGYANPINTMNVLEITADAIQDHLNNTDQW